MPRGRSEHADSLLLIAATTVVILTAQRYFQTIPPPSVPRLGEDGNSLREPLQHGDKWPVGSPFAIPRAVWKDILWRTYQRSNDDRLLATAAGVVFFGLLAVFPAMTALVSSYGLFADASTIGANLQKLAPMLPEGSFQIVQDQIARVLDKGGAALGWTFLFGLALAIWSANAGVKAVIDALNVAYEVPEKRGFIRLNLLSLAFTIGGIAALLVMVSAVVAFPLALDHLGLPPAIRVIVTLARWPLLFVILLIALGIRTQPAPATMEMACGRNIGRRPALDRKLRGTVLVSFELRGLQRDLRLAWRGHRPDDVDVDVGHCCAVRGGVELGDRASGRDQCPAQHLMAAGDRGNPITRRSGDGRFRPHQKNTSPANQHWC